MLTIVLSTGKLFFTCVNKARTPDKVKVLHTRRLPRVLSPKVRKPAKATVKHAIIEIKVE